MKYTKKEIDFLLKNNFKKDGMGEYYYSTGIVVKGDHAMDIADLRLKRGFFKRRITYFSSLFDTCFIDCLINEQKESELRKDFELFVGELNKAAGTNFKLQIKKGTPIVYTPIDISTIDFRELCNRFEKFIVLMDGWLRNVFCKAVEEGHHNFNFKEKQKRSYDECKQLTIWD